MENCALIYGKAFGFNKCDLIYLYIFIVTALFVYFTHDSDVPFSNNQRNIFGVSSPLYFQSHPWPLPQFMGTQLHLL